ncbi:MAG: VanW family protein [Clostridiales bacterium]|jgi:hypothetical protein|nr:VanW family protein [Clostridiales bacterium]
MKKFRLAVVIVCIVSLGFAPLEAFGAEAAPGVPPSSASFMSLVPRRFGANFILDGVALSEYTYPVAYMKFNLEYQKFIQDFQVKVNVNGNEYNIHAEDLSISADTLEQLQELWILQKSDLLTEGSFQSKYTYDAGLIEQIIDKIYSETTYVSSANKAATGEPVFNLSSRTFSKSTAPAVIIGYNLTRDSLSKQVYQKINEAIENTETHSSALNIKADPIYSTAKSTEGYGLLGSYTTYTTNVANRNTNIRIASESLNGTRLSPGTTFSFNGTLGFTSKDKGYKEAGILVNGKPDTGLGGGICQVSSTMYNAVLAAKQKIVERHAHSAAVGYVPAGRDATVSYGSLDFKFQNITSSNMYMTLDYNNQKLTVSIYGKR